MTAADAFCEAFPAAFLAFHRRDGRRTGLTNASRAVLQHLAQAGPVSIGEAARHLDRAQSVVSEIVAQLEGHGLLEREPDPDNRRRTLVWLTTAGLERLRADADVLDRHLVSAAMAALDETTQRGLLDGIDALLAAATTPSGHHPRRGMTMSQTELKCESCGMPIESGHYCQFCTDEHGNLQDFDTRFAAMVDWQQRRTPDASRETIEAETSSYMSGMPAWRNHPRLTNA